MHQSSMDNMRAFRDQFLTPRRNETLTILDLGSTDMLGCYRPLFDAPSWMYTGLDLEPGPNVDVVLKNPYHWREIPSASADVFISGQCLEHIEFFWLTILEIERVLKIGGMICLLAPSGGFEHRYPVDCWRFYPDGFAALARYARLEVLGVEFPKPSRPYTDDSNLWKDCRLIARKRPTSLRSRLLRRVARGVLRRMAS